MSDFWLRCDACNKELNMRANQEMQLAVRFKPSLFRASLERIDPHEQRIRCRGCGWVNVFVPARILTRPDWRNIVLK